MSEQPEDISGSRAPVNEDDHDLLTFGEAGERLRVEIAAMTKQISELQSTGDADALAKARARLHALQAAAARNTADPSNDANFEKFFGYTGGTRPRESGRSE